MVSKWLQNVRGQIIYADLFPIRPGILSGPRPHYVSLVDDYVDLTIPNTQNQSLNLASVGCAADSYVCDSEVRAHIMGNCVRLPYSVSVYNTGGIWDDKLASHKEIISDLRKDETPGLSEALREINIDRGRLEWLASQPGHVILDHVHEATMRIFNYADQNSGNSEALAKKIISYKQRLVPSVASLLRRTPPVRINYPEEERAASESLLMILKKYSFEYEPQVLFGWRVQSGLETNEMEKWRNAIRDGNPHLRRFLNFVSAEPLDVYGVPSYLPYGLTGGLMAVGIELNQNTTYIDTWGNDRQKDLWRRNLQELGEEGIQEIFNKGHMPPDRIKVTDPFGGEDGTYCIPVAPGDLANRFAKQEARKRGSLTHIPDKDAAQSISIVDQAYVTYTAMNTVKSESYPLPIVAGGQPVVLMMLYGGMRVTSPRGISVEMKEGEASLIPASAAGIYIIEPLPELEAGYPDEPRHAFIQIMGAQTFKFREELADWTRLYGAAFLKGLVGEPLND